MSTRRQLGAGFRVMGFGGSRAYANLIQKRLTGISKTASFARMRSLNTCLMKTTFEIFGYPNYKAT